MKSLGAIKSTAVVVISAMFVVFASSASADTKLTIHATLDNTWPIPNSDVTVTLDADGTITTVVSPGPDPDPAEIPDGAVPDDADPAEVTLTGDGDDGMFESQEELEEAVIQAIVAYLLREYIDDLFEVLEEMLESLNEAGSVEIDGEVWEAGG